MDDIVRRIRRENRPVDPNYLYLGEGLPSAIQFDSIGHITAKLGF
jgi:hypothetical protein